MKYRRGSESILRVVSMVLAAMAALIVGLDTQTKTLLFKEREASPKLLGAVWFSTIISAVAAAYQFIHGMTYTMFGGTVAAIQGSLVALTGVKHLQWDKLCNIYTRFCVQAAAGLVCGLFASLAMAVLSSLSAYRLFRLYPCCYPSRSGSHAIN